MVIIIIEYKLCGYIVNGWKKGKKNKIDEKWLEVNKV